MKREEYIAWDEYFMGVALLSAKRSKDPNTQVGACIVNEEKRIIGVGYNGLPIGCISLGKRRRISRNKISFCVSCRIKCYFK